MIRLMDNIKTILAGLSLTMAVGMPAAASDELTMVVGLYRPECFGWNVCLSFQPTNGEIAIGGRCAGWQPFVPHDES